MEIYSRIVVCRDIDVAIESILSSIPEGDRALVFRKGDSFLVEDAEAVMEKAYLASEERVVLILAANRFGDIVQNKLLKLIEEPPPGKEFVLVIPSKSMILPTIRSRLPLTYIGVDTEDAEEVSIPDMERLDLKSLYDFVRESKYLEPVALRKTIEKIAKGAMSSESYELDEKSMDMFRDAIVLSSSRPDSEFVLTALLLKLLARKRKKGIS